MNLINMEKLKEVRVVGFDLDGTLYQSTPKIDNCIRTQIAKRIFDKKPELQDLKEARDFFELRYAELKSGSKVLKEVGYKDGAKIVDECALEADILDLIFPNEKLANIIKEVSLKYETYLLTSSFQDWTLSKLKKIGIDGKCFSNKVYGDTLGIGSKYNGEAFDYILNLVSDFNAFEHVYIGNSKISDILPAKLRGMKTIAVWSQIPEADISIKNINEIGDFLL